MVEHISYDSALRLLENVAAAHSKEIFAGNSYETLETAASVGKIAFEDVVSHMSTPPFDSSAMDGYAVMSPTTRKASEEIPCVLRVIDSIAAGDRPPKLSVEEVEMLISESKSMGCAGICFEIMT